MKCVKHQNVVIPVPTVAEGYSDWDKVNLQAMNKAAVCDDSKFSLMSCLQYIETLSIAKVMVKQTSCFISFSFVPLQQR